MQVKLNKRQVRWLNRRLSEKIEESSIDRQLFGDNKKNKLLQSIGHMLHFSWFMRKIWLPLFFKTNKWNPLKAYGVKNFAELDQVWGTKLKSTKAYAKKKKAKEGRVYY
jgi:hypothetical protein